MNTVARMNVHDHIEELKKSSKMMYEGLEITYLNVIENNALCCYSVSIVL